MEAIKILVQLFFASGWVAAIILFYVNKKHWARNGPHYHHELEKTRKELEILQDEIEKRVLEQTEKAREIAKRKDQFIARLGHDLKTPLTPIIGLLPVIYSKAGDKETKQMIESAMRGAGYVNDMVSRILSYARADSETLDIQFRPVDVAPHIEEIVYDHRYLLFERPGVRLELDMETGREYIIETDITTFHEILENLISNAVKYTPGDGRILVSVTSSLDTLYISVKDNGIGLTKDHIAHIFDEFYKADDSRHDLGSTGLGLSICKKLVEQHGGRLWAESDGLGKGACFSLTIPLAKKTETETEKTTHVQGAVYDQKSNGYR